jgi:hypothetical protein
MRASQRTQQISEAADVRRITKIWSSPRITLVTRKSQNTVKTNTDTLKEKPYTTPSVVGMTKDEEAPKTNMHATARAVSDFPSDGRKNRDE